MSKRKAGRKTTLRSSRRANRSISTALTKRAISQGRSQAAEVLASRKKQRKRRTAALRRAQAKGEVSRAPLVPIAALRALGPATNAGILIAEGDSWFDYPFHDVLESLEDDHGFDVESVAHRGDRVEDMAFSVGQLSDFTRRLEKLLRDGKVPSAILLSGGGNDIAGTEFGVLLNHANSPIRGLNDDVVNGVIAQRIRIAYTTIIASVTAICQSFLQRPIPIVIHGYDYAVPDGRGFWGGWGPLPGPWLEPGFRSKGFGNRAENIALMKALMDRFNEMLQTTFSAPAFSHVHYLDLRGTLSVGADYKRYWDNELHPTERGFAMVAAKFARLITTI